MPNAEQTLRTTPRDVFLQVLMMVMLYLGVISLITLSISYIEVSFPDALTYYPTGTYEAIRLFSSMLLVTFPLFLLITWLLQRDYRKTPEKHELRFRKWMVYLTLFVSAITMVIDLITLVNRFYDGELTLPFALKVLAVLILAGGVFGYYLWDVQSKPGTSRIPKITSAVATFLSIGMLVLGFFLVGSPAKQRDIRMDERRVSDLQMTQNEIINYWQTKDKLPKELADLTDSVSGFTPPMDPETNVSYEYSVVAPLRFKLCANFKQPSPFQQSDAAAKPIYGGYYDSTQDNWVHQTGNVCFERTIDPEKYAKPKY